MLQLLLLDELLHARLLHDLEQPLVLRAAHARLVEGEPRLLGLAGLERALPLADEVVHQLRLLAHEARDVRVVLGVRDVPVVPHRARDDERRAGLVDQHRVHLVDDREDVRALHPLLERDHHVVAQVVEAELVVRAVRDVAEVRRAAFRGARLRVVEAADGEAEPAVEMPHPLRVAPREVVVDRDEVRPAPGEGVEVQRERRDERLALARRHLGDLPQVQLDAADELDVVVDHVPRHLAADHRHRRADEAARRLAHRRERLRQELIEHLADLVAQLFLQAAASVAPAQLEVDLLALGGVLRRLLELLQLGDPLLERVRALGKDPSELRRLPPELLLGDRLQTSVVRIDLIDDRLDALTFAIVPGAEDLREDSLEHRRLYRYSACSRT
jgi:hypothetical protein